MISAQKAKHLDLSTMFTYSHANTPLGQSERACYLSYFINKLSYFKITAKKLPKSDTTAAGPAGGGRQQRGVDLRETNESHQGGCCK